MTSVECLYYHEFLSQCKTNTKEIFRICDKLLGRNHDLPLPPSFSEDELASGFSDFFISKIAKIREALVTSRAEMGNYISVPACIPPKLASYCLLCEQDIIKIITKSPTKCCVADPIPTELLKQHVDILVPILTKLVNTLMQSGCFSDDLKKAWVKPLLNKPGLDLVDKNYRPVPNLQFTGKLIENVVTKQLPEYIADHNPMEPMQSVYQANHSKESALVHVKADILASLDKQEVVCLVLLNVSAAFDTVDHSILLHRLESVFGITGTALDWIQSYLAGRSQRVVIGDTKSEPIPLTFGVSQGSVLRHILFTLYTCPLGEICGCLSVTYHLYADDQQLYLSFHPSSISSCVTCLEDLEACIAEIKQWMSANMLKLNDNKTECIALGTSKQLAKVGEISIVIGNIRILPVD